MKSVVLLLFAVAFIAACTPTRHVATRTGSNILVKEDDEEEYELIIIDPGFDTWFATNAKPANFYSQSYYELKNYQYVVTWNELADRQIYARSRDYPFENRINYEPNIDYGLELNYKLFYYFKYIESRYGRLYGFSI